ncbi:39S ribosomal protein L38, mitochondrial-like [Salmo trutta]|uniref:39S ribosomal protein L38, mitochondrial-like n=1 Tax=Salmo trutta TaxID=8032 RepID=UPI0011319010|nr:39S ribosomal protein L38, mitochondrial-like [Salmo trutta]XP_029620583.1 39S ribosomal protein L38, mitochondrial-like [Salmo trutta]
MLKLEINSSLWLDRVQAGWEETSGPYHVQRLANHYGIFKDLFPMAYFVPWVTLSFSYDQDSSAQVHYGNHLMPKEMSICWIVKGSVCWLVGNIPSGAVTSGEDLCQYLAPIPTKAYRLSPLCLHPVQTGRNHQLP